ncbi:hypothetical protein BGL72_01760 [Helicobacter pylori]|nr:hypothetical protein BGL72_01760 [Helicobacter pylori]
MTKQKSPFLKIKVLVSQSQNARSVIKKFKNSNAFLKTSPKIGDRVVFNGYFLLGVLTNP